MRAVMPLGRVLAGLLALAAAPPAAWADPFDWEEAAPRTILHTIPGGGRITLRLGTIAQGGRFDTALEMEQGAGGPGAWTELLREMTDTKPDLAISADRLFLRWSAIPVGAARPARVERCWRLAMDAGAVVARPCGTARKAP